MHESALTFGLLASSLVMLAVMPLLNQNNSFSNPAMAQGYDDYYGDNSYSTYATEENKYECQKGPLEGFFVSSVEFCKNVKFDKDDRKDNRTGTRGPAGPVNNNSTLVNTFNCINPNVININTDTNQSSLLSSSGLQQLIQDGVAQGLNGTLDGLSLNKTIINLCVINDNDTIVIEGGNATDSNGNETVTCEECFSALSTVEKVLFIVEFNKLIAPQAFPSFLNLCIDAPDFPDEQKDEFYTLIQTALINTPGVGVDDRNEVLRCLQQLGLIVPPA